MRNIHLNSQFEFVIELVVFDMYMHVLINFPSYTSYKSTCTFLKSNICGSCIKLFKRSLSLEKITNPFVYDVLLYVFIIFICKKLFVLKWNVKWCNSMRWRQYDIRQLSFFALNMSHFIENLTGDMLQWRQGRKPPEGRLYRISGPLSEFSGSGMESMQTKTTAWW